LITIAYSGHRVEALQGAGPVMAQHGVVVLEEPPLPGFEEMLAGSESIDDYLELNAFEFPDHARRTCEMARELDLGGVRILQLEPYLETLDGIHDAFAAGTKPDEFEPGSLTETVYRVERGWTGALLHYYWTPPTSPFDAVLEAVQRFARADASKGRLRDALRADAIAPLVQSHRAIYVESGYLHLTLRRLLRQLLGDAAEVRTFLPGEPAYRALCGKPHLLSPGDRLTLRYTFNPKFAGPRADLLAARALIQVKIEGKEELHGAPGEHPHAEDDALTVRLSEALTFEQCRGLFPRIRELDVAEARGVVGEVVRAAGVSLTPGYGARHFLRRN